MKKIYFLIVLFLFLFGCTNEREIYFDLQKSQRKIVINSVFNKDSVIKTSVMTTHLLSEDTILFENYKNCDISIYADNSFLCKLDSFKITDNYFNFGYFFNPTSRLNDNFDSVKITVISKDFGKTEAVSLIPEKPKVKKFNFYLTDIDTVTFGIDSNIYAEVLVNFSLEDFPDKDDYYSVKCYLVKNNGYVNNFFLFSADPQTSETYLFYEGLIFSDKLAVGNTISISFSASLAFSIKEKNPVLIEIKHITKDYYDYLKSYKEHLETSQNFFTEYYQMYTNIQNGMGIFSVYASQIDTILNF